MDNHNLINFQLEVELKLGSSGTKMSKGYILFDIKDGITLTLTSYNSFASKNLNRIECTTIDNSKCVTLVNCFTSPTKFFSVERSFKCEYMFIGNQYLSKNLEYKNATILFDFLTRIPKHEEEKISHNYEDSQHIRIQNELCLILQYNIIDKKTRTEYTFSFNKFTSLYDIFSQIKKLQAFYIFLFSNRIPIKKLSIFNDDEDSQDVYFTQRTIKNYKDTQIVNFQNYALIYPEIPKLIVAWFSIYNEYSIIIENIISNLCESPYLEIRFLDSARNLEKFYDLNEKKFKKRMSTEESKFYEKLIVNSKYLKNIINNLDLDNDVKKVLIKSTAKNRLKNIAFPPVTFADKLNALIRNIPDKLFETCELREISGTDDSPGKRFAEVIAKDRNNITHANNKIIETELLYLKVISLEMIIKFLILEKTGLSTDLSINEIISNKYFSVLFDPNSKLFKYHQYF